MTASAAVIRISTQYKGLQRKHNRDNNFKLFPIISTNHLFNQLSLIFYQLVTLSQISNTVKENKNQKHIETKSQIKLKNQHNFHNFQFQMLKTTSLILLLNLYKSIVSHRTCLIFLSLYSLTHHNIKKKYIKK